MVDWCLERARIHLHSMTIESKLEGKFPTLQLILCSQLFERAKSSTWICLIPLFWSNERMWKNIHGFTIGTVSHLIKQLLKRKLTKMEQKERLRSHLLSTRVKNTRILASLIFDSLARLQLQQEVSLNLVPMAKVPAPPRGNLNAEWESQPSSSTSTPQNLVDSAGQGSGSVGVDPADTPFPIRFKPTDTVEYDESKLSGIRANVFYVPASSNQEAFDLFILFDQVLYIFQFSIGASQEIKEAGVMKFSHNRCSKRGCKGRSGGLFSLFPLGQRSSTPNQMSRC